MAGLLKRESRTIEPFDVFGRFDRMFGEWMRTIPFRTLEPQWLRGFDDMIHVDEYRENGTLVIRAELPGIDPEKDVELTLVEGMLDIQAQRRIEEKTEDKGYVRHELRYGTFTRRLPMPEGVKESDVTATYKDGILEIRIPLPEPALEKAPAKITVAKG